MKLDNEFTVGVPIEQAWAVLTDLELIAPCMPGAQLTGVNDGVYSGKVKIKVGPVTAEYAGTAQFSVKDETAYRAVIDARGRDSRGNGNATAVISAQLQPGDGSTRVSVSTDLTIAGRIAQFGSGMIKEVSAKLLGQFVTCLEGKLSAGAVSQAVVVDAGSTAAAAAGTANSEGQAATSVAASSAPASVADTVGNAGSGAGQADGTVPAPAATVVGESPSVSAATSTAMADTAGDGDEGVGRAAGNAPPSAGAPPSVSGPEPAALDLMSVAGRAIVKRLVPLVIALVLLAVIIYLIVR
jgi:carbon monoxide dehydrogenase subunit G